MGTELAQAQVAGEGDSTKAARPLVASFGDVRRLVRPLGWGVGR